MGRVELWCVALCFVVLRSAVVRYVVMWLCYVFQVALSCVGGVCCVVLCCVELCWCCVVRVCVVMCCVVLWCSDLCFIVVCCVALQFVWFRVVLCCGLQRWEQL